MSTTSARTEGRARGPQSNDGRGQAPHRFYGVSGGLASCASCSACAGNHAPAAGSTMPLHSGSVVEPEMPRLHDPSDSPGTFTHRNASASGLLVFVVGGGPRPRPGGLHQSCLSGYATVVCQGPRPSRLVSTTKCVAGCTEPSIDARRESMPTVFHARSACWPLYGTSCQTR